MQIDINRRRHRRDVFAVNMQKKDASSKIKHFKAEFYAKTTNFISICQSFYSLFVLNQIEQNAVSWNIVLLKKPIL